MNKRTTIGFLDSGAGGITVLASALRRLPDADYLFYADTDHVPYGVRTPEEVTAYSMEAVRFLTEQGAEAAVVACNTATSMAIRQLRQSFSIPIVGMEPAVKPAAAEHPAGKILVCATPLTIGGEKLHTLIDRSFIRMPKPDLVPLPALVELAEAECFDWEPTRAALAEAVGEGKAYDAVVLGCTHFLYFRDSFRRFFPGADIIDGNEGTVRRLLDLIDAKPTGAPPTVRYFESGRAAEAGSERELRYKRFLDRAFSTQ